MVKHKRIRCWLGLHDWFSHKFESESAIAFGYICLRCRKTKRTTDWRPFTMDEIKFGTDFDTVLYRSSANILRTDDVLDIGDDDPPVGPWSPT